MLNDIIQNISGIGDKKAKLLNKLNINTVEDLLRYYPRDYEDRSETKDIELLEDGDVSSIVAQPCGRLSNVRLPHNRSMQKLNVADESGSIDIIWFNQPYLSRTFVSSEKYIFYGKIRKKGKKLEMTEPKFERADRAKTMQQIVPIYPLMANITQKMLQLAVKNAACAINDFEELLPRYILDKYNLCDIKYAIKNIHFPESFEDFNQARKRLAFEELLMLQLGLTLLKNNSQIHTREPLVEVELSEFYSKLRFELTNAQKRTINEIKQDLLKDVPMRRLVQGDVGCGKTIVAAAAIDIATHAKGQVAMMVPTEILAKQHYNSLTRLFGEVDLLIGSLTKKEKECVYSRIESGDAKIVVGTHALLSEELKFKKLDLIITDEQHRFGVSQRKTLEEKGNTPHLLVMTATPIPRTLSLILYGDLDISIIDEMPPNRQVVKTYAVDENYRERINAFIKKTVLDGNQVYIVCPLVEDSNDETLISADSLASKLSNEVFPELRISLLHGRMKTKEKNEVMSKFSSGEIDILVSTTVVEVGVDVPNAVLMIIENGERFGLSQLHQLRGRVGRGDKQSFCVIFMQKNGDIARQRMEIMSKTNNGFEIAEKDLEIRGPGEFFGTRQHGIPEFRIANLYTDIPLFHIAGEAACDILKHDMTKNMQNELDKLIYQKFTG